MVVVILNNVTHVKELIEVDEEGVGLNKSNALNRKFTLMN